MAWAAIVFLYPATVALAWKASIECSQSGSSQSPDVISGELLDAGSVRFSSSLFGFLTPLADCTVTPPAIDSVYLIEGTACTDAEVLALSQLSTTQALLLSSAGAERPGLALAPKPRILLSPNDFALLRRTSLSVTISFLEVETAELVFVLSLDPQRDQGIRDFAGVFQAFARRGKATMIFEVLDDSGKSVDHQEEQKVVEIVRQWCVGHLRGAEALATYRMSWLEECSMSAFSCGPGLQRIALSEKELEACVAESWVRTTQYPALRANAAAFHSAAVPAPSILLSGRPLPWSLRPQSSTPRLLKEDKEDKKHSSSNAWFIWIIIASCVFVVAYFPRSFVFALACLLIALRMRRNQRVRHTRETSEVAQTMESQALQALAKLEVQQFTGDFVDFGLPNCVICLSEYSRCRFHGEERVVKTQCRHVFHEDCLKVWFKNHIDCPMCALPSCKRNPMETPTEAFTEQSVNGPPPASMRSLQSPANNPATP